MVDKAVDAFYFIPMRRLFTNLALPSPITHILANSQIASRWPSKGRLMENRLCLPTFLPIRRLWPDDCHGQSGHRPSGSRVGTGRVALHPFVGSEWERSNHGTARQRPVVRGCAAGSIRKVTYLLPLEGRDPVMSGKRPGEASQNQREQPSRLSRILA